MIQHFRPLHGRLTREAWLVLCVTEEEHKAFERFQIDWVSSEELTLDEFMRAVLTNIATNIYNLKEGMTEGQFFQTNGENQ